MEFEELKKLCYKNIEDSDIYGLENNLTKMMLLDEFKTFKFIYKNLFYDTLEASIDLFKDNFYGNENIIFLILDEAFYEPRLQDVAVQILENCYNLYPPSPENPIVKFLEYIENRELKKYIRDSLSILKRNLSGSISLYDCISIMKDLSLNNIEYFPPKKRKVYEEVLKRVESIL